jgi:hypothetical protein
MRRSLSRPVPPVWTVTHYDRDPDAKESKPRSTGIRAVAGLLGPQGQFADSSPGFQFRKDLWALGQIVSGGASGAEDASGD